MYRMCRGTRRIKTRTESMRLAYMDVGQGREQDAEASQALHIL